MTNSSLEVAVSGRGGTYDYIHVSELGKIAAKDPLKAKELISGTLNAGANAIVTIESTAEGDAGVFYDMCMTAEEDQLLGNKLTKLDYKFFFLSWVGHPNYTFTDEECEGLVLTAETKKYFKDQDVSLNNMFWYQSKKREQKEMMAQEYPSNSEEAFSKPLEGSYYGKFMRKMLEDGRICDVVWNPDHPVYTYCDIGHSDFTVNLYVQHIGRYSYIFDMYVGNSKYENNDLEDMIIDLKSKPYVYGGHVAPHDMDVFEWGVGATRKQQALLDHGIDFQLAPKKVALLDGIEAVKRRLPHIIIDKERCRDLLSGLRSYRRMMLPDGSFSSKPHHDGSDFTDPVRYMAVTGHLVTTDMVVSQQDHIEKGGCLC